MKPVKKLDNRLRDHRCQRKTKFYAYQTAFNAAKRMNIKNERTMKLTKETRNRPYKCEYCLQYHIGKWSVEKI